MLKIKIIAVGKMKDEYLLGLTAEFLKRLKPFAKIEIVEVPHESFRDPSDRERVQKKEADEITKALSSRPGSRDHASIVLLEERGKEYSSEAFSKFLEKLGERGDEIVFVLGGALGLHESLRAENPQSLSLSKLTFPHELARVLLLEQCYRASCIMTGKIYHY